MLLINIDTDGLITEDSVPAITQISAVDGERNVILSATITNDAPFNIRLLNGVPAYGVDWQQILPIIQSILGNYHTVYFWDATFDKLILESHGVDFSNNDTHSVKTEEYLRINKPDTVSIKGYQTLGKCINILEEYFPISEEEINLDF